MTLEARNVTRDQINALIKLRVHPEQENYVASNAVTLAQAPYETGSRVVGLWENDLPVGLMAWIDMRVFPWPEAADDLESIYLWRLMIDKSHQRAGYGKAALELLVNQARKMGFETITSSVAQKKGSPLPFYESFGFQLTGGVLDGELVIRLKI